MVRRCRAQARLPNEPKHPRRDVTTRMMSTIKGGAAVRSSGGRPPGHGLNPALEATGKPARAEVRPGGPLGILEGWGRGAPAGALNVIGSVPPPAGGGSAFGFARDPCCDVR